jgi:hypothetical protein
MDLILFRLDIEYDSIYSTLKFAHSGTYLILFRLDIEYDSIYSTLKFAHSGTLYNVSVQSGQN